MPDLIFGSFVWDIEKESLNIAKHQVDFMTATEAFFDTSRVITQDEAHSKDEQRLFCLGLIGEKVLTVRFTYRAGRIRIFGAGYWTKGRKHYEKENKKHSNG